MNKIYTHLYSLGNRTGRKVQKFVYQKDQITADELPNATKFIDELIIREDFEFKKIDIFLIEDAKVS